MSFTNGRIKWEIEHKILRRRDLMSDKYDKYQLVICSRGTTEVKKKTKSTAQWSAEYLQ